jgi:hypothetical protein
MTHFLLHATMLRILADVANQMLIKMKQSVNKRNGGGGVPDPGPSTRNLDLLSLEVLNVEAVGSRTREQADKLGTSCATSATRGPC